MVFTIFDHGNRKERKLYEHHRRIAEVTIDSAAEPGGDYIFRSPLLGKFAGAAVSRKSGGATTIYAPGVSSARNTRLEIFWAMPTAATRKKRFVDSLPASFP